MAVQRDIQFWKRLRNRKNDLGGPIPEQRVTAFHVAKDRGDLIELAKQAADTYGKSLSWLICEAIEYYLVALKRHEDKEA